MKTARFFTLALAAFAFAACSQDDSVTENVRKASITLHAPEFTTDWSRAQGAASGKGFRIKHELDEKTGMKFSWTQGDITGVFAENSQQQLPLKMAEGQDAAAKVDFIRKDYELAKGVTYVAYYPVVDRLLQQPRIEVSYLEQEQDGNHSYAHLAKYDYMVSDPVTVQQTNTADFQFHHQGAILRLLIDMPAADTYSSVTLDARAQGGTTRMPAFTTEATLDLFNKTEAIQKEATKDRMTLKFKDGSTSTTESDKLLEAWLMISPADFTTNKLVVTVNSATGKAPVVYTVSPGKNFVKGKAYQIKVDCDETDEWVDLGLPSGTLWAKKNVGAKTETDYGSYIGFGDPTGNLTSQNNGNYPYYLPTQTGYQIVNGEYCGIYDISYIGGYASNYKNDMAHAKLGSDWSLPLATHIEELIENTTYTKTTIKGVSGYKFTSKKNSAKYIFIPCAGYRLGTTVHTNDYMYFWTGEMWYFPNGSSKVYKGVACSDFNSNGPDWDFYDRAYGFSVRAIKSSKN